MKNIILGLGLLLSLNTAVQAAETCLKAMDEVVTVDGEIFHEYIAVKTIDDPNTGLTVDVETGVTFVDQEDCTFLLAFYCMLRYFFSRRLSMLGTYAVISSWSMSRLVVNQFFEAVTSGLLLLWLWSVMWSTRSGTYRSGLFTGLIAFYLVLFKPVYILLMPVTLLGVYFFFLPSKTVWFRRQWLKYNIFGAVMASIVALLFVPEISALDFDRSYMWNFIYDAVFRKAFFVIAPLGGLLIVLYLTNFSNYLLTYINLDRKKLGEVLAGISVIVVFGLLASPKFFNGVTVLWIMAFLALFPIEWIFQSISRLRSKRNLIYAMYILVCLLDSQMENRIRIVAKMFLDNESLKYLIQY